MHIVFITEEEKAVFLSGSIKEIYELAKLMARENGNSGFIGIINDKSFVIKAHFIWESYDQKFRPKLRNFIKKYVLLNRLQQVANELKGK